MRLPSILSRRPSLTVGPGERLLAWARRADAAGAAAGGVVGGTRDALYLPQRLPWEQIAHAEWDQETSTLRVVEVGTFGEPQPTHAVRLVEPGRLVQLVRERVTASIALQRHVTVRGRQRVRVLARRPPGRHGELAWFVEYDDGLDPSDPTVQEVVDAALAAARADVGHGSGLDF